VLLWTAEGDSLSRVVKSGFTFLHEGHCASGWLKTTPGKYTDAAACAANCRATTKCAYFAHSGTQCAKYTSCLNDGKYTGTHMAYKLEDPPRVLVQAKASPCYKAWRSAARRAYKTWRSTVDGGVYVAIATTVTLHRVDLGCGQCANHTASLCAVYEFNSPAIGTGGSNGVVGAALSAVGCGVLNSPHRVWRNSQAGGVVYVAVASTEQTAAATDPAAETCRKQCAGAQKWRRTLVHPSP